MSSQGLTSKTVRGISWSGVSVLLRQVTGLMVVAILARLLRPDDFGLLTMAGVYLAALQLFSDFGFPAAIIQKRELSAEDISTCFWMNLTIGFLLYGISVSFAGIISAFFGERELKAMIWWLSLTFIFQPLMAIQVSLIYRELRFKKLAFFEVVQSLSGGIGTVAFAFYGYGVYSLVWGGLLGTGITVLMYWLVERWRPNLAFSMHSLRSMSGFGLRIMSLSFIAVVRQKIDQFVIGKLLGPKYLGQYTLAYNLMDIFRGRILSIVLRVLFPSFSEIQHDSVKVKRIYVKGKKMFAIVAFPFLAGLASIADEFVPVVYGPNWTEVILPLKILCLGAIPFALTSIFSPVIRAIGKPEKEFWAESASLLVLVPAVIVGASYGVPGVAMGVTLYSFSFFFFVMFYEKKYLSISFLDQVRVLEPSLISTFVMVVVLYLLRELNEWGMHLEKLPFMLLSIFTGIVVFVAVSARLYKQVVSDIISFLPAGIQRKVLCIVG